LCSAATVAGETAGGKGENARESQCGDEAVISTEPRTGRGERRNLPDALSGLDKISQFRIRR
jgi:hypothetical protein